MSKLCHTEYLLPNLFHQYPGVQSDDIQLARPGPAMSMGKSNGGGYSSGPYGGGYGGGGYGGAANPGGNWIPNQSHQFR